jgi:hypothetical protein
MGVGNGNIAVAVTAAATAGVHATHTPHTASATRVGGSIDSACGDGGWDQVDAEQSTISRQSGLHVRHSTNISQRCRVDRRGEAGSDCCPGEVIHDRLRWAS